jgi:hypothetical protein
MRSTSGWPTVHWAKTRRARGQRQRRLNSDETLTRNPVTPTYRSVWVIEVQSRPFYDDAGTAASTTGSHLFDDYSQQTNEGHRAVGGQRLANRKHTPSTRTVHRQDKVLHGFIPGG